jgi:isoleucyl-tRNA synthetase
MTKDYRDTIFLPRTDFPMKAGLPKREPEFLKRWHEMDLFHRLRDESRGREKFILHDGPPYANGHIHTGTAMNKILKDVVNRSQQMMGKDANYVPGWDCHGLPIEWKIEEKYRAEGKNKDEIPIGQFRQECREFADHWIDVQREEFKRLGVEGDWDNPYTTMTFAAEAQIVRELHNFAMDGSLYKGSKSVLWSVVEKTALAEAEVEYHDHTSTTIHVRFPIVEPANEALAGASVVIWTTTPWTIPGNRAVACSTTADYVLIEVTSPRDDSLAREGERLVMARELLSLAADEIGFTPKETGFSCKGAELAGTVCRHPLYDLGYQVEVPVLLAGFVTMDVGTGLVHIAPGHGADDFELGVEHGLEVPETVAEDGIFYDHMPLFAGKHVFKVNGEVAASTCSRSTARSPTASRKLDRCCAGVNWCIPTPIPGAPRRR